jgi:predicted PurR-regulated permease PerM
MMDKRTIDISTGIIFRTILILLGIWFLYVIRDIIAILFIAIIIAAAIEPMVDWMHRKKIPRALAVAIIYAILFSIIGAFFYFLIPPLVTQLKELASNLPLYSEKISIFFKGLESYGQTHSISFSGQNLFQNISDNIAQSSSAIFSTTIGVFTGFVSIVVVLSLIFYMSVKKEGLNSFVVAIMPAKYEKYAVSVAQRIKVKMGRWIQGQLFSMLAIAVLDFSVLYFLGVPYALILAILGGLLEIIPYVGPIISAFPAVLSGFLVSPTIGLLVVAAYIIIHQIEGHVIIPNVMRKAVGLNPIIIILAILVGAKVSGVLGAILSVPIITALSVFVDDLMEKNPENIEN